jgi:hypothetical protein
LLGFKSNNGGMYLNQKTVSNEWLKRHNLSQAWSRDRRNGARVRQYCLKSETAVLLCTKVIEKRLVFRFSHFSLLIS